MRKAWLLIILALIVCISICIYHDKARAETLNIPDTFSIVNISAYRGVIDATDQLYIVEYKALYTNAGSQPSANITNSVLCRLANDTIEVKSVSPYSYYNYGWCHGIVSIYLSADEVSALSMPWSSEDVYLRLQGIPFLDWDGTAPNVMSSNVNYLETDGFATRIRVLANVLENDWELTDPGLIAGGGLDTRLTVAGEEYFINAIPNLRTIEPGLFESNISAPDTYHKQYYSDYYYGGDTGTIDLYGASPASVYAFQTGIVPSQTYEIAAVELKLNRIGLPNGTHEVFISPSDGDISDWINNKMASATFTASDISTFSGGEWTQFVLSGTTMTLTKDESYVLVISGPGEAANYVSVHCDTTGEYADSYAGKYVSGVEADYSEAYDLVFAIKSDHGYDMNYIKRMEHRLDDTPLDVAGAADLFGMSRMWLSSIIWIVFTVGIAIMAVKKTNDPRSINWVFLLLIPIGALIGMLSWVFAAGIAAVCSLIVVYDMFWKPSPV